jgi:hypothetical protein
MPRLGCSTCAAARGEIRADADTGLAFDPLLGPLA